MSTSLIRNSAPLGPYRRPMPRALRCPLGGWVLFLMSFFVQVYDGESVQKYIDLLDKVSLSPLYG